MRFRLGCSNCCQAPSLGCNCATDELPTQFDFVVENSDGVRTALNLALVLPNEWRSTNTAPVCGQQVNAVITKQVGQPPRLTWRSIGGVELIGGCFTGIQTYIEGVCSNGFWSFHQSTILPGWSGFISCGPCGGCYQAFSDSPDSWNVWPILLGGYITCTGGAWIQQCPCHQAVLPTNLPRTEPSARCSWSTSYQWLCLGLPPLPPGFPPQTNSNAVQPTLFFSQSAQEWVLSYTFHGNPLNCVGVISFTAAIYACRAVTWNCTGTNFMTLKSSLTSPAFGCVGWPGGVQVSPAYDP